MTFKEAVELAKKIISRFNRIEGKPWKIEGSMIELSKQVGDLSKLIMSYEGYYSKDRVSGNKQYRSDKGKIGDELADILYVVIRIADHYNIDLEKAHIKARRDEDKYLRSLGV